MAPIPDSIYFPSLDKCLSGEQLLISWKTVSSAITSDIKLASSHQAIIEKFLSDSDVVGLLANPFEAFPAPSAQTKSVFETRSSAINATPSQGTQFNVKEIKEDALWLSNVAKIDEVSALRIVVLECQGRASEQLMGRFSEEELSSIREAAGNNKYSSPIPVSLLVQGVDVDTIQKDFQTQNSRRQRTLQIYLSERRHLLKCTEHLFSIYCYTHQPRDEDGRGDDSPTWQINCADALAARIASINKDTLVVRSIKAIGVNMLNLQSGSGWFADDGGRDDLEILWRCNQITEATHTMELIWHFLLYLLAEIPSSHVLLEWFRLQHSCTFFNNFAMDEPSIQVLIPPLQSISITVSMAMFSLGECLSWLEIGDDSDDSSDPVSISADVPADENFILNRQTIVELHDILLNAADNGTVTAGPAILCWVMILQMIDHRVKARHADRQIEADSAFNAGSSDNTDIALPPDIFEDVIEELKGAVPNGAIEYLGHRAVDGCQAFDTLSSLCLRLGNTPNSFFSARIGGQMRLAILSLIKISTTLGYFPEIVEALISSLTGGQTYWDILDSEPLRDDDDPVAMFLKDEILINSFLKNAQSRYPFEPLPFLQLIHALATLSSCHGKNTMSILTFLEEIPIFTYNLPADFTGYETIQEEENSNNIRLTRSVELFESRSDVFRSIPGYSRSAALVQTDQEFYIPAGTLGRIVSESGPRVAFWFHRYSGLKYFGRLLETFLTASDQVDATTGMPADRDSVSEIIGLLATLLLSTAKSTTGSALSNEIALQILQVASAKLSNNRDILTVVFDIFEEELQNQSAHFGADTPLDVLISCVQFIHAVLPILPGRVWSLLARSGLLGVGRDNGRLPSIVEGVELLSGRYDLLISCCRLFDALVEDFAVHTIQRRSGRKPASRSREIEVDVGTGIPDQVLSKILLSFSRYLVDVLETSPTWKFADQVDRQRLSNIIGTVFDKILQYGYGLESSVDLDEERPSKIKQLLKPSKPAGDIAKKTKVMDALMPSALHLVDSFLSPPSGTVRFQPLLRSYYDGLETPELTIFLNRMRLWTGEVNTTLSFSKTLLQVSNMLGRPSSQLESELFRSSPLIARLYAVNDAYRVSVVALFEALIITASNNSSEPPSLLGRLGSHTAKNFLHLLSNLDKPLSRDGNLATIWHFLSIVVSNRQQWFANYLLTGKTPKDALKKTARDRASGTFDKPLLSTALDILSNIKDLPKIQALAVLEFVALAQNFWPWTVCDSPKYNDFIKALLQYLGGLQPIQPSKKLDSAIDACYQTRIAAYIAEILAMHMFHARQTGKPSQIPILAPNMDYFTRFAVNTPQFNTSLHTLLKNNFEARYPGCSLRDLKRTTLEKHEFGKEYFYGLSLADKMLSSTEAWTGKKDNGLRAELATANVNLSLVDAQIALFHSWRFLSIELTSKMSGDEELQKRMVGVVIDCLTANTRSQPPEEIFSRLSVTRTDFAAVITQRLIQAKSTIPKMNDLLPKVWDTIVALRGSFETAVLEKDVEYYRSLLKLLFLAVRIHAEAKPQENASEDLRTSLRIHSSTTVIPIILNILNNVVSLGLRELSSVTHDSPADSSPEDLALITAIMQSCLRIPGIEFSHPHIVTLMTSNSTPRLAITLFSWSDNVSINGDPIYGELSILFLLELSSIPLMAEQLALDGILGYISSANMTSYLRRPGVSPFAESAGLQRCYSIWARGILPLLLNLLAAVQAAVATEVALFLNQFQTLVTQCEQSLDAPETNRIIPKGTPKYITLTICREVHSMALLHYILNGIREQLKGTTDVPVVKWDSASVLENVEFWLGSRALLRERLLPMGEREADMVRRKEKGAVASKLEEKVVVELLGIRDVLGGDSS